MENEEKAPISALRVAYTLLIFFNNFASGISLNIIGATLVDMSFVYQLSLEKMSTINFSFCIGYMIGSVASFLSRWINRQLLLSFSVLLQALLLFFLPFYGHYWLAFAMVLLSNAGCGVWDSATSLWIVELWPVRNSAVLQINQFAFGLGTIVAPLIAAPFVHGTATELMRIGWSESGEERNETVPLTVDERIGLLAIPFAITGVVQAVVPIIFFVMYFTCPYVQPSARKGKQIKTEDKDEEEEKKEKSAQSVPATTSLSPSSSLSLPSSPPSLPNSNQTQKPSKTHSSTQPKIIPYRKTKIGLMGLCLGIYIAAEVGFLTFCTSMFQYLPIALSASEAAHVQSVLSTTFTLGRLITALISLKVAIDVILAYHFLLQVAALTFFYAFCLDSRPLIYAGMAFLGYAFSAIWPAIFGFTEQHLGLTSRICSLYTFLVGVNGLITPLILSYGFRENPLVLVYITASCVVISATLFTTVRLWILQNNYAASKRGRRRSKVLKLDSGKKALKDVNGNVVAGKTAVC